MRWYLLFSLLVLTGCQRSGPTPNPTGKPVVVATFSVLGDMTRNIGGEHIDVLTLVGPDGDAHTFQPTPQDIASVGNAAAVVEIGAKFETAWFDGAYKASRSSAKRVSVSDGLKLLEGACHHGPGEEVDPDHTHELDPHIWHEVNNALHMVERIRDALCELDPSHADDYRANATRYSAELRTLDSWIVAKVKELPEERRKLVTSHDTFGYFAKRYGFRVVGSVLPSFSTEAADPSAAEFAQLVKRVQAQKIPAIFCESSHNPKLAERLASAAGVKIAPPLYTDALGPVGSPGGTYLQMMRYNVTTMVDALKP